MEVADDPDAEVVARVARRLALLPVPVGQDPGARGVAEQDAERHRQAEPPGASGARGGPADTQPHGELAGQARDDRRVGERGPERAAPRDAGLAPQSEQQLQLLLEDVVVVLDRDAEDLERLGVGTAPGGDLGATARDEIELREVLVEPHGVEDAEHRDRARQGDRRGAGGDGREHDGG